MNYIKKKKRKTFTAVNKMEIDQQFACNQMKKWCSPEYKDDPS